MDVYKYNDFILDKQFNSIIENIFIIVESGKWIDDNTIVWDFKEKEKNISLSKDKLKDFLSKLPKEKVKTYFFKFLDKIKSLPVNYRKKILLTYASIFFSVTTLSYLLTNDNNNSNNNKSYEQSIKDNKELIIELAKLNNKSSFDESQYLVKGVEKGYSADKKDRGNYVKTKWGKRFVGTNHGISAPVLMNYLGRVPSVDDMKNLSYQDALEIYKQQYWTPQNLGLYNNQSIANLIYDGCVNQGIKTMKDIVRAAYIENGIKLGSLENPFQEKWIKMANKLEHEKLFNSIKNGREKRYKESITFKTHGSGWINRLNSIDYQDIKIDLDKLGI